jgi:O-antigen ligase
MRPPSAQHPEPAFPIRWPDRIIEAGALFLLVFTPLAYGTVEPWSEAIAELVVLGMVLVWVLGMLRDWELRIELPPGWLPAYLFLALVFLQASPLPSALVGLVSPWTLGLHQTAAAYIGGVSHFVTLSLAPHATLREALKLGAVAAFFLVCYNTYGTRAQITRAIWTMIMMGSLISIFGIVQRMTWNSHLYWVGPETRHASVFGPFVNRAHFAGLIVVVVPLALALMVTGVKSARRLAGHGWADRLRRWNSEGSGPRRLIPFLILLMGGAALVSGSRGGLLALIAALVLMVGLGTQGRSGAGGAARIAVTTVLIILAAIWIGGDILWGTVTRLAEEVGRPGEGYRLRVWSDAVDLWRTAPAMGTGLGTFGVVYPQVRTIQTPAVFTHAESDWVQLFTDVGVAGVALVLAAGALLVVDLFRRWRRSQSRWSRTLALAALVTLVGTAVQGMGNFNLTVMSNLFFVATVLALAPAAES